MSFHFILGQQASLYEAHTTVFIGSRLHSTVKLQYACFREVGHKEAKHTVLLCSTLCFLCLLSENSTEHFLDLHTHSPTFATTNAKQCREKVVQKVVYGGCEEATGPSNWC